MDEKYRLVFRGEILEGQHRAVVKRRLMELMKLSEAQTEKLFSGSSVTVKRDVDKKTAARYQTLFKQAGGQLRVLAQQTEETSAQVSASASGSAVAQPRFDAEASTTGMATFTVQTAYFPPPAEPPLEIEAPDFDIAEVGVNLLDEVDEETVIVPEVDFELAEVGVDILNVRPAAVVADVRDVDFDLAEVGVNLGVESAGATHVAPDISHLQLVEN